MKSSLNTAFIAIWLFVVATCVASAFLMQGLYRLGVDARVDAVAARVDKAAASLQQRFAVYAHSFPSTPDFTDAQRRRELGLMLQIVLEEFDDVEGGFYAKRDGFIAYAFPSYEGAGAKQDVPAAETSRIETLAASALSTGLSQTRRFGGARQTLIIRSTVADAGSELAIWVMARAHVRSDDGTRRLLAGLALLVFFTIASGIALLSILKRWNAALACLATRIADVEPGGVATLAPTGHREIDRVVELVAAQQAALEQQRRAAVGLQNELARAQRVASVGRMTAQLIHEIRNPIAAMRLRAENALAGAGSREAALAHVLDDVHRLDDLLERMQAMTRLNALHATPVAIDAWLAARVAAFGETARRSGVTLEPVAPAATWSIDPDQLGRALDNLVLNAIQHVAPDTGFVRIVAAVEPGVALRITVADNGPGIDAASIDQVFEPFHTTRAGGSGLGLSIAREIVEAHGGTLGLVASGAASADGTGGAMFSMELPWRVS